MARVLPVHRFQLVVDEETFPLTQKVSVPSGEYEIINVRGENGTQINIAGLRSTETIELEILLDLDDPNISYFNTWVDSVASSFEADYIRTCRINILGADLQPIGGYEFQAWCSNVKPSDLDQNTSETLRNVVTLVPQDAPVTFGVLASA